MAASWVCNRRMKVKRGKQADGSDAYVQLQIGDPCPEADEWDTRTQTAYEKHGKIRKATRAEAISMGRKKEIASKRMSA